MENIRYKKLYIGIDMRGCPNRCKHCWLGWSKNPKLDTRELVFAAREFQLYTEKLVIEDWYREPDYADNYKETWELCNELSGGERGPHYELASVWRLARDRTYAPWLRSLGVKYVQLTFFGGQEITDFFTGRTGAYRDLLKAIDLLLENGIAPRIQVFVNKRNIMELQAVEDLIDELELIPRCEAIGMPFAYFVHQGSCDGENAQFYPEWVTPADLVLIPERMREYTLRHFDKEQLKDVFGSTEAELYDMLMEDSSTLDIGGSTEEPVLYIDGSFDVYPNFTGRASFWRLGNLKEDGGGTVLSRFRQNWSTAQKIREAVPLCDLVTAVGNRESQRLFGRGDYIDWLLNKYCQEQLYKKP